MASKTVVIVIEKDGNLVKFLQELTPKQPINSFDQTFTVGHIVDKELGSRLNRYNLGTSFPANKSLSEINMWYEYYKPPQFFFEKK